MPLPEWLNEPPPPPPGPSRRRKSWLTTAANRLASLPTQREPSAALVRMDPRAAILGFVGLIVCATLLRSLTALALCWLLSVALALAVGARPRTLGVPSAAAALLTGLAMLPAAWNGITPGPPLVAVAGIAVTMPGIHLVAVVVLRTLACLAFGIGLFASNRAEDLFAALRWFRVPSVFVGVLLLAYRYLLVLARAALEVHMARQSRVAEEADLSGARRWLAERIGALFARSRELGEEVHLAMIARGFDNEWLPAPYSRMRARHVGWIAACWAAAALLLLVVDRGLWT